MMVEEVSLGPLLMLFFACQKVVSTCSTLLPKFNIKGIQIHHKDHVAYKEANGGIGVIVA